MPRKTKNQVVELEDSDVESVVSDDSHHTDDGSDNESVVSSDEEVEIEASKKVSKKVKKSTKEASKPKAKKATKSKSKAKSSPKEESADEDDEESSMDKVVKAFENVSESFTEMTDIENPIIKKFAEDFMSLFIKTLKALSRTPKKSLNVAQAATSKEIKTLEKQKRKKASSRKKGGFTQAKPVPVKLCKFLGIPVDSELPRSEVTKKCYAEFKDRKMNIGDRKYKFDKESAKVFGASKGDEFHIHSFQGILASIYNASSKTSKSEDL